MARELRRTHGAATLLLPVFGFEAVEIHGADGPIAATIARLSETISGWLGRTPTAGEVASSPALTSGGARGAGVAGAGLLAKAFGGLGAGNIAVACLGGGAVATIACVATGVFSLPGQGGEPEPNRAPASQRTAGTPEHTARGVQLPELIAPEPAKPTAKAPEKSAEPANTVQSSDESTEPAPSGPILEPDVAPEVQEFGVAGAGTPVGGAPADTNDADGASASTVRQEFGP
ncbi:MAG: hypothetical protein ACRDLO_09415 [Solirubrobacterales bacterium]